MEKPKIIECPRDAMQGIKYFIPTASKVQYINQLLNIGFDTIDFGSFVSPEAIPQLKDTATVLDQLDLSATSSKLLAIVANERGAQDASNFDEIKYLGYPFSISETFQQRNTNTSIAGSMERLERISKIAHQSKKELVVYISMGFGNPYDDPWNADVVIDWSNKLNKELGINIIALSDTIGVAKPDIITGLFDDLIPALPTVEFAAHFHTTPDTYAEKIEAAYTAGCRRFDGALRGFGGCPMAKDELVGNMPTEKMIHWFKNQNIPIEINQQELEKAVLESNSIFNKYF